MLRSLNPSRGARPRACSLAQDKAATALEWWKKVDDAHRLTVEDRRDYVGAALMSGEVTLAAKQIEALMSQRAGPTPHDILLAGQLAARQSDPVLALDYAERVLADKRTRPYDVLSAATLVLSVTRRVFSSLTLAHGNKSKLWRAIQRIPRRSTRSLF